MRQNKEAGPKRKFFQTIFPMHGNFLPVRIISKIFISSGKADDDLG
ncbi:MAG: hypothetical protein JXB26_03460 [Candidatus Aminicenantes bacterium]|nr:hypothetical protein [Candidatus Aminicenantes bacterium]